MQKYKYRNLSTITPDSATNLSISPGTPANRKNSFPCDTNRRWSWSGCCRSSKSVYNNRTPAVNTTLISFNAAFTAATYISIGRFTTTTHSSVPNNSITTFNPYYTTTSLSSTLM